MWFGRYAVFRKACPYRAIIIPAAERQIAKKNRKGGIVKDFTVWPARFVRAIGRAAISYDLNFSTEDPWKNNWRNPTVEQNALHTSICGIF